MAAPKIQNEQQLLDTDVRRKLIEDCFDSPANARRKAEAFKAHECLKDKTANYVLDLLLKQFDRETVYEMQYAIANVSILRKVIEKLAKVYSNGVKRSLPGESETATKQLEDFAKLVRMNESMAKANRYFRTFKNCLVYPHPVVDDNDEWGLEVEVLPPFKYDVIENPNNPKLPLAIVLSDYCAIREPIYTLADPGYRTGAEGLVRSIPAPTIAKAGGESDPRRFVWWTRGYHFTTNAKGEITSGPDIENPILSLPFVNIAGDQDGQFFAEGGDDLVDAGVKINTMITNVRHVAISQGYGQMYMTGKNLPSSIKVGPTHCIKIPVEDKDDPAAQIGFLNSNPPLDDLARLIEMDVALMLSTNNLSTHGFSVSLQGGQDFASGVALMIDKSESIEDVNEQAQIFIEREPRVWAKLKSWHDVYSERGLLNEKFKQAKLPEGLEELLLKFPSPKPVISESEELDILEKRKEMGLNTEAELLMRDDPSLTEEQANEKIAKIKAEKLANMEAATAAMTDGNQGQEGDGLEGQDDNADPASDSGSSGSNPSQS